LKDVGFGFFFLNRTEKTEKNRKTGGFFLMCETPSKCLKFQELLQLKVLNDDGFQQLNELLHQIYGNERNPKGRKGHLHLDQHYEIIKQISKSSHNYAIRQI
jgi:hypothetical protein